MNLSQPLLHPVEQLDRSQRLVLSLLHWNFKSHKAVSFHPQNLLQTLLLLQPFQDLNADEGSLDLFLYYDFLFQIENGDELLLKTVLHVEQHIDVLFNRGLELMEEEVKESKHEREDKLLELQVAGHRQQHHFALRPVVVDH